MNVLREAPTRIGAPTRSARVASAGEQGEVVVHGLAEADARIGHERLGARCRPRRRPRSRSAQERADLGDDVVVAGLVLHRAGLALHVHRDVARAGIGDDSEQVRIVATRGDVVDDRRPGFDRGGTTGPWWCRRSPAPDVRRRARG